MTTSTNETDSFDNGADDALSTAEMLRLLNAGLHGDTDVGASLSEDEGAKPGAPASGNGDADIAPGSGQGGGGQQEPDPANAVIVARDGVHQIPYEKLQEARDNERHWREQAQQAQQQLTELQAQAQARAEAGQAPTKRDELVQQVQEAIQDGADPSLFGDFSEQGMADGVKKQAQIVFADGIKARDDAVAAMKAELEQLRSQVAPVLQKQQQDHANTHVQGILTAHPDASSVLESQEFTAWKDSQPSYMQQAIGGVLNTGTTAEVIELLGNYKAATQKSQASNPARTAAKAVQQLQVPVPNSPSDIPGGRAGASTFAERLAGLSDVELFNQLNTGAISQAQFDQFLSRKS